MIDILAEIFVSALEQGLILAVLALGMSIPFRLLNFPDLTAEGSYALGGCMYATLIFFDISIIPALLIAGFCSGFAGVGTSFIYNKYKVNSLLAGIIISTMIYSINLRVMGKPNMTLPSSHHFANFLTYIPYGNIMLIAVINCLLMAGLLLFLRTEKGLQLRAVGLNNHFASKQGININHYNYLGLFLGNLLAGLSGILFVYTNHYSDVSMNFGIIIQGLAAMMIGEKIIGTNSLVKIVSAPLIGALLYQQIQSLALLIGFAPSDLKFVTGFILLVTIALS